jgi:hypothetical protein
MMGNQNKQKEFSIVKTSDSFEPGDLVCLDSSGNAFKYERPSFLEVVLSQIGLLKKREIPIGVCHSIVQNNCISNMRIERNDNGTIASTTES